jgi:hypothetical protein
MHVIVFDASQPTEVQYAQVLYWMNFLATRMVATEPIGLPVTYQCFSIITITGHCGVLGQRSHVALVGTRADQLVASDVSMSAREPGTMSTVDGEALLSTVRLRYAAHFHIVDRIFYVDTSNAGGCAGLKALRTYLANTRQSVVSVSDSCASGLPYPARAFAAHGALTGHA